jgi:hypothetical protein
VVVFWILALPAVVAFYLAYGLIEDMIQKDSTRKHPLEQPKLVHPSPVIPFQSESDQTPQFRGYDSSELFREDTLIRLREIHRQVEEHNRNIENNLADMRGRTR